MSAQVWIVRCVEGYEWLVAVCGTLERAEREALRAKRECEKRHGKVLAWAEQRTDQAICWHAGTGKGGASVLVNGPHEVLDG